MTARVYDFRRVKITGDKKIADLLNDWAICGWRVVTMSESADEYSFVLLNAHGSFSVEITDGKPPKS